MVDTEGYKIIDASAQETKRMVETGQWYKATQLWASTENVIINQTHGIDFYNILTPLSYYAHKKRSFSLQPGAY